MSCSLPRVPGSAPNWNPACTEQVRLRWDLRKSDLCPEPRGLSNYHSVVPVMWRISCKFPVFMGSSALIRIKEKVSKKWDRCMPINFYCSSLVPQHFPGEHGLKSVWPTAPEVFSPSVESPSLALLSHLWLGSEEMEIVKSHNSNRGLQFPERGGTKWHRCQMMSLFVLMRFK